MRRYAFMGLLCMILCSTLVAEECLDDCAQAFLNEVLPLAGAGRDHEAVTIYVNQAARDSPWLTQQTVNDGIQRWNGGCKESEFPLVPRFQLDWESEVPGDWEQPHRTDVLYLEFLPGVAAPNEGSDTHPASHENRLIKIYERCPKGTNHGLACFGDNFIRWNEPWGAQAVAHEIGHALGLNHDRDECNKDSAMAEVTGWGDGNRGILGHHCELASRLNDYEELCSKATSSVTHLCEACRRELGGKVDGLAFGEVATLKAELSFGGQNQTLSTTAFGSRQFTFPGGALEGSSYQVTVEEVSNEEKTCAPGPNSSGLVGDTDITDISLGCECETPANQSRVLGANTDGTLGCERVDPGRLHDPKERPEPVLDLCFYYVQFCDSVSIDPWWWYKPGPPLGDGPCENEPNCNNPGYTCKTDPETGQETCTEEISCKPTCGSSTASLTLSGPTVAVDNPGTTASGVVQLTGFARDVDGLLDFWIYVDGVKVSGEQIETGRLRPDACAGAAGDCDPFSGFAAELDTTSWTDGVHRLDIIALDAEPDYPMGTRIVREVTVDNTCTSTSAPTVAITDPIPGEVLAGPVSVRATAGGETPVERVQYYLDGVRVTTDWVAPYEWPLDTTTVPDGFHELRARAVDTCGVGTDSAPVVVEVLNANDPPRVELETPTAWVTLAGTAVEVSGWALDEDGVDSVSLRLNGQVVATAGALEVRERAEVCSAFGSPDPRCPDVGWALRFDSTLVPDGLYTLQVVVTDGRGGTASMSRQVTIGNAPPAAPGVSVPQSVTAALGDTVTFQVTASGTGPFGYQWQVRREGRWWNLAEGDHGGRVTGVATSALSVAALEFGDAGGYRCMVTNAGGARASGSASLTVVESIEAPTVTSGIDQLVVEGGDAQLTVSAEGFAPLSYRWQKWNGSAYLDLTSGGGITGTTGPVLSITGATLAHGGLYRCRVTNPGGTTVSAPIRLTVDPDLTGSCIASPTKLCLLHDRFRAEVVINGSAGQVRPYSNLGGFFTLGNPANVEVAVKVLDGVGVNGRYWVFHGSMTSHAYTLTVTDTVTGATKTYHKAAGSFCGVADTAAFGNPESGGAPLLAAMVVPLRATAASTTGSCQSTTTAQCLLNDRFRVEVYRNGFAQRAVPVSALSAAFTFGSTANPEVVAKVLDGTVVNDWYWVFFGSLTSQGYEVRVTDTTDGTVKVYPSPGPSCGQADTTAF